MLFAYLTCGCLFLLSFILLSNAINLYKIANRWMGLFFLFAGFALLSAIAEKSTLHLQYPLLIPAMEITRFAMAPVLYLSVLYYTRPDVKADWKFILHFIPAILFIGVLAGLSHYLPPGAGLVVVLSLKAQLAGYWIAGLLLIRKSQFRHSWLLFLMLAVGIMIAVYLLASFVKWDSSWHFNSFLYLLCANAATYYVIKQRHIQHNIATPRLNTVALNRYKAQLEKVMREDEPYTDSDLNLSGLAMQMNISVHELSYLLNTGLEKNFYQYINEFRVEKAKELLQSEKHQHINILAIGFEAGFNSKTAFNTSFKKLTGKTPVEFRKTVVRLDTEGR
ncbi:Helix-turn-helix domain-containing protein [Chitinophaga jiangningensis]|uniref:Helix-turn-helix domain-containing protein n=1 Tax=Chitinophaga jiangningensis TaxID=1419482 RepID=A0A1M7LSE1_9BACT|nr:helix-turn-helix domain-containing protein [Chitinophaga jiangningensis]SHM81181.1 Helix-turn-helix domain-containing protein [Chitinophaga jiangningensis]